MKKRLVATTRKALPESVRHGVEGIYRKGRARITSARYGYPARKLRVIAITGTNGKTTTACFMNEILKEAGMRTALFTTAVIEVNGVSKLNDLNATVPTVKELQQFFRQAKAAEVDYVVLEVTSLALHQYKLQGVKIEAAIFTNLTHDHLDYHKNMSDYAKVKGRLFAHKPEYITLNADDDWYDFFYKYPASKQRMSYGAQNNADAHIQKVTLYPKGSEAQVLFDHQTDLLLTTALPGRYNVYNMVAAASTAFMLGVKLNDIIEGIANLESVPGRFEYIEEGQPYRVVVDYAHTPDALEKVLDAARGFTKGKITVVFGATGDRDKSKRPEMGKVAAKLAHRVIVTDDESYNEDAGEIRQQILEGTSQVMHKSDITEVDDRREAIRLALSKARRGDMVIIAGLGHEQFRVQQGKRIPWDDRKVVRELLSEKKRSK